MASGTSRLASCASSAFELYVGVASCRHFARLSCVSSPCGKRGARKRLESCRTTMGGTSALAELARTDLAVTVDWRV